jgi:hypothetical protein
MVGQHNEIILIVQYPSTAGESEGIGADNHNFLNLIARPK